MRARELHSQPPPITQVWELFYQLIRVIHAIRSGLLAGEVKIVCYGIFEVEECKLNPSWRDLYI